MLVGALDKLFALQSETLVDSGENGSISNWTNVACFWGKLSLNGESLQVGELSERLSHSVVTRYRDDIKMAPGMRLSWNDRLFMIRAVLQLDEARRWTKLLLEETLPLNED